MLTAGKRLAGAPQQARTVHEATKTKVNPRKRLPQCAWISGCGPAPPSGRAATVNAASRTSLAARPLGKSVPGARAAGCKLRDGVSAFGEELLSTTLTRLCLRYPGVCEILFAAPTFARPQATHSA